MTQIKEEIKLFRTDTDNILIPKMFFVLLPKIEAYARQTIFNPNNFGRHDYKFCYSSRGSGTHS
jgi:hypothetical protein